MRALRNVLKESTGDELLKTVADSLMTITPEHAKSLKAILGPLIYDIDHPLHCVRCHWKFIEMQNHSEACVIYCNDSTEPYDDWASEGLRAM